MEETTLNALERIDNPILVVLLCVLIVAVCVLYMQTVRLSRRVYTLAVESIGVTKDVASRLEALDEKLDNIIK